MAGLSPVSTMQQYWRVFAQAADIVRNMLMTSDITGIRPPRPPAGEEGDLQADTKISNYLSFFRFSILFF